MSNRSFTVLTFIVIKNLNAMLYRINCLNVNCIVVTTINYATSFRICARSQEVPILILQACKKAFTRGNLYIIPSFNRYTVFRLNKYQYRQIKAHLEAYSTPYKASHLHTFANRRLSVYTVA
jgi:hypothetical protein